MEFLKTVWTGFGFGVGVCGAIAILATLLRAKSSKESAENLASLKRLEALHTAKLGELQRTADAAEFWIERELAKDQTANK